MTDLTCDMICGKVFQNKADLMKHQKRHHFSSVLPSESKAPGVLFQKEIDTSQSKKKRKGPKKKRGEAKYADCLVKEGLTKNLSTNAKIMYFPKAMKCSEKEFEECWRVYDNVDVTPNPWDKKHPIKRRQGSYGARYSFGRQKSTDLGKVIEAPQIIQRCIQDAQERATQMSEEYSDLYTGANVNWYSDGLAWIEAHQDTEKIGYPIFSYTFIVHDKGWQEDAYRYFIVSTDKNSQNISAYAACIQTRHGDLIVMDGELFQRDLYHWVPKAQKNMMNVRRINVTVRAWGDDKEVRDEKTAKPLAKKTAKPLAKYNCSLCTYENSGDVDECQICNTPRFQAKNPRKRKLSVSSSSSVQSAKYNCSLCTYENSVDVDECQICNTPRFQAKNPKKRKLSVSSSSSSVQSKRHN